MRFIRPGIQLNLIRHRSKHECDSFVAGYARDSTGKWQVVVQTEDLPQRVAIDLCHAPGTPCKCEIESANKILFWMLANDEMNSATVIFSWIRIQSVSVELQSVSVEFDYSQFKLNSTTVSFSWIWPQTILAKFGYSQFQLNYSQFQLYSTTVSFSWIRLQSVSVAFGYSHFQLHSITVSFSWICLQSVSVEFGYSHL